MGLTASEDSYTLAIFLNCSNIHYVLIVLDLVSQVRNVVLMNVYLDLENPGGSGCWNGGGYMSQGRKMGS